VSVFLTPSYVMTRTSNILMRW